MIDKKLTTYIEREILPRYHAFDKAHQIDHARTVIEQSLELATHYEELDREMVYVIAAFHDIGLCEGRELHHIVSGRLLMEDSYIASRYTEEQRTTMREAIEDHRASSANAPRSLYGMIVAEADRVISVEVTLTRTVQYGLAKNPTATMEQHYQRFVTHLVEKYAEGGYLKLWIPYSNNKIQLEKLRAIINNRAELYNRFLEIIEKEKCDIDTNNG